MRSHAEEPFLAGGGELAKLIARYDWSATSVGSIESWPQSVKSMVSMIVRSRVPMVTLWGAEGVMIYNDAYSVFAGAKHPRLLGSKVREGWSEVAAFNDHVMRVGMSGGTLAYRDQELTLYRNEYPERIRFDLDYSPIVDEAGRVSGVIAIVTEAAKTILAEQWRIGEQERLRRMFEQAPAFMAMLRGPDHVFEFANPAYHRLVGERELRGLPARLALPEVNGQGFFELLDRVYSSGIASDGAARPLSVRRNAQSAPELRYVDFVYQPVKDDQGAVVGIFVQGVDVTDRVTSAMAIRESEARHRQILDSAIDYAIVATDLDGKITRWNEGAHRILGWTEDEIAGRHFRRCFTPEDRNTRRPESQMRLALALGHARDERWHVRKSGEQFWANGELTPLRDESGTATGFVQVLSDRTAEHHARQALQELDAQLRRAQEAGGIGVFTIDLEQNTLRGTPQFCRLFGFPESDHLSASDVEQLVIPEDASQVSDQQRRNSGHAPLEVEYRVRRRDTGEIRAIARKAEYEFDAEGRPIRMVGVVQDVTERRAVQRALEDSAEQFRTLAQAMPNQVWTAAPDGTFEWCNDQMARYSGAQAADLEGAGVIKMIHPKDRAVAAQRWSAAVSTGRTYESEFRLLRNDGAYRWHLSRALPIRGGPRNTVIRWIGTNTDIHEHKMAEAENVRDRDRMWAMSQDLLLVCTYEGVITAVNPSARRLLDWEQVDMLGHRLTDFLHPDDVEGTIKEAAKLAGGASTLAFENRYRTKGGDYRLLDWTAVPEAGRIHAVGRDITRERAAVRDQQRIWTLSPVLKLVASTAGVIQGVNPAWCQALGWSLEEVAGKRLDEFIPAEELAAGENRFGRLQSDETVRDQQLTLITKDGNRRQISWTFVRENETLYGFGRDVTDQRNVEEALRQSQKMEVVGQLTGGIAHDFNNLLQSITGSLDLVQKRIGEGRVAGLERFVSGAMISANRAAALTHRLLEFSRRQPLDPRPVQANALIDSMVDLLRRTLGPQVQLELILAAGLWLTRCDANQLESAILNLAINARDAMPEGGQLTIETSNARLDASRAAQQREVPSGQYVCISVSDTGTGMSPDTAAKAFDPFFTTKPKGQGTGLGLSMIYGFARQSDGYAKIDSELGRGTTLNLYLPRHWGEADHDDNPPHLSDTHTTEGGETVLVVEDEPVVRALIVEVLGDLGYDTLQAADGTQGMEMLRSDSRIDLLVTDIGLPGLNGKQLAEAGSALRPALKTLFMTGYAEGAAASGFLKPGMQMITKPFAMEALASRIKSMIEG